MPTVEERLDLLEAQIAQLDGVLQTVTAQLAAPQAFQTDLTALAVAQKAQTLIGIEPITDFADNTQQGAVANQLYETLTRDALSSYPWSFAFEEVEISKTATEPKALYKAAYGLPNDPDMLSIQTLRTHDDELPVKYKRKQTELWTKRDYGDTLVLHYHTRTHENTWPDYFVLHLIYKQATAYAAAITRQKDIIEAMANEEVRQLTIAKSRDSQGESAKKVDLGRFRRQRR